MYVTMYALVVNSDLKNASSDENHVIWFIGRSLDHSNPTLTSFVFACDYCQMHGCLNTSR